MSNSELKNRGIYRKDFVNLVTEYPEKIKSLQDAELEFITKILDRNEIKTALTMIAQVHEEKQGEGNKKIYQTINVKGVTWMVENLAFDDGEGGVIKINGNYYYQYFAAQRIAKRLGFVMPSPEAWNELCETYGGELLNKEIEDPLQYKYKVSHLFSKFRFKDPIGLVTSNKELKGINNNFYWTNRKEGNSVVVRQTYYPKREILGNVINQYNYLPVRLIR